MAIDTKPAKWKILLAFAVIYFVWGSTYFAIKVGVHEVPPLTYAAMRFFVAGLALCAWAVARGEKLPDPRQWLSVCVLAVMVFVIDYGALFWAEQHVPSGIAAVVMATISVFMALSEIVFLRTRKFTLHLALALLVGLGGVAVLVSPSLDLGGAPINWLGATVLIIGAMSWSVASTFNRKLPLPASKVLSAGSQMLVGGILLAVTATAFGEMRGFDPLSIPLNAWFALLYLIVAGSITGFTTYIWLIHHESPTKIGTYAYVNPVVAVLIGYFLGGEALNLRTALGTAFVLISVMLITTMKAGKAAVST